MKVRDIDSGEEFFARFEKATSGQSSGLPEVVIEGRGPIGPIVFTEHYEVQEAAEEELTKMRLGGYPIRNESRIIRVKLGAHGSRGGSLADEADSGGSFWKGVKGLFR